jgi:uncharacterized protein YndB with AHSA1/START domain
MAVSDLQFKTQIAASPEAIFEIVADLPNYGTWLPNSDAFGGTNNVTPYPVRLGTTYVDAPPIEKPGVVTEFEPPNHIGFHQIVQVRRPISVDVDARIRYSFEARGAGTFVIRELRLTWDLPGLFKIATPLLVLSFRRENLRTLAQLKRYAESK